MGKHTSYERVLNSLKKYSFSECYINRDCQMSLTDFRVARCFGSSYADVILHWLSTNNWKPFINVWSEVITVFGVASSFVRSRYSRQFYSYVFFFNFFLLFSIAVLSFSFLILSFLFLLLFLFVPVSIFLYFSHSKFIFKFFRKCLFFSVYYIRCPIRKKMTKSQK